MDPPPVIRFAVKQPSDFPSFLVHIHQTGQGPLDLELVGTEGAAPYELKVKDLGRGRSDSVTLDEWTNVFRYGVLGERSEDTNAIGLGMNVSALLEVEVKCTLTFERTTDGITQQTLGELVFQYNSELEIELLDWTGSVSDALLRAKVTIGELRSEVESQRAKIAALDRELEDFIQLKTEHEDSMMAKFVSLLNAKKLKIRDQQRLLAHVRLENTTDGPIQPLKTRRTNPSVSVSRELKRKADDEDLQSSDDFESSTNNDTKRDSDEEPVTPERVQDDTTDEDEDEDDSQVFETPAKPKSSTKKSSPTPLPPKRVLPFNKIGGGKRILKPVEMASKAPESTKVPEHSKPPEPTPPPPPPPPPPKAPDPKEADMRMDDETDGDDDDEL
ncbi:MAG: hypothetical protein M1814_002428 [Vezdaea aestivalis]|nr:MAG: hypothetical protein M1814_002428 [Vezdaea aestivalis]